MRVVVALLVGVLVGAAGTPPGHGQSSRPYAEVFYPSAGLRIQAYLYRPAGDGPFPAVVYNHGSRIGREREEAPFEHVGRLLTRAGYVALVAERRGYGRSDGPTWPQDVGRNRGRWVTRLQEETDDVLAAVDHLNTLPFVDARRRGLMGWSFGGVVTMFAISRSNAFGAAVNQAGGALTWNDTPELRSALLDAADKTTTPTLLLVAENDRTTASITAVGDRLARRGVPHRVVIYGPFGPQPPSFADRAPGHRLFSAQGIAVWERDVLDFLAGHLGRPAPR